MIIFFEEKLQKDFIANSILEKLPQASVIKINSWKNVFKKNVSYPTKELVLVIGTLTQNAIHQVPANYTSYDYGFFLKTSIGCFFDCSYCFLKGYMKNPFSILFVNYDEIKRQIEDKINSIKEVVPKARICFYSSDYSDIQGFDYLTEFNKNFIPFFEQFDNVLMETRTKSANINSLLELGYVPSNTEVAFSLNPQEVISKYEHLTSSLESRIKAINTLLEKGFKVGLRFMPIIPIENYEKIYEKFLDNIVKRIPMHKVNSIDAGVLLFTKEDYNKIIFQNKAPEIFYKMVQDSGGYVRFPEIQRQKIYNIFEKYLGKYNEINYCLENLKN